MLDQRGDSSASNSSPAGSPDWSLAIAPRYSGHHLLTLVRIELAGQVLLE